jgi:hypothetical protein
MATEKSKLKIEKIAINPGIEWATAQAGVDQLKRLLDTEIHHLSQSPEIRNAYSPITWTKLCRTIHHVTEGMAAVRLATEGKSTSDIHAITGIGHQRIAAFRAWNTRWVKVIRHYLTIQWRHEEERRADIHFLRSVGIAVEDAGPNTEGAA